VTIDTAHNIFSTFFGNIFSVLTNQLLWCYSRLR